MSLKGEGQRGCHLDSGGEPWQETRCHSEEGAAKREGVGMGRDLRDRIGPDPRWVRIWGLGGVLVFPN